jgi:hypothetical protein
MIGVATRWAVCCRIWLLGESPESAAAYARTNTHTQRICTHDRWSDGPRSKLTCNL